MATMGSNPANEATEPVPRVSIRPALAGEADLLTEMAIRAKGHWGYATADLLRWRAELIVAPGAIEACPTWVAQVGDSPVGFYLLLSGVPHWTLDHLWVLPDAMGQGVGRALLRHAVRLAADQGALALAIDADPNAEPFYLACGASRVGEVAAPVDGRPDRVRPQLLIMVPV